MPDIAPQNKRTKAKAAIDPKTLDPKEVPVGDTTSSVGEKNIVGVQGRDGNEDKVDTSDADDKKPFVP